MTNAKYVVITPARNEADYIGRTLQSMAAQTAPPLKWVIVSDGSTDGTDDLVATYADRYPWIELVQRQSPEQRNFAAKVHAFEAGYARVKDLDYRFIGNVDADVSFDPDQFEFLLRKFEELPDHGLLGTVYIEREGEQPGGRYRNPHHVNGSMQLFRREAFEQIGGYEPIPLGGVDWLAELKVRRANWKTRSFAEKHHFHHKPVRVGTGNLFGTRFRYGYRDFVFGSHPLFQCFRIVNQMGRRPFLLGGLCLMAGYLWGCCMRPERPISKDMVAYYRWEQFHLLKERLRLRKTGL